MLHFVLLVRSGKTPLRIERLRYVPCIVPIDLLRDDKGNEHVRLHYRVAVLRWEFE